MKTEFSHYIPKRIEGEPRSVYEAEWQAWIDSANWVINHPQLFSEQMVRFQREQLQVMDEYRHGKHWRAR